MSTASTLITLGVLIIVFPYLGLPHAWSNIFIAVFGIVVFAVGFGLRSRAVKTASQASVDVPPPAAPEHHETSSIA